MCRTNKELRSTPSSLDSAPMTAPDRLQRILRIPMPRVRLYRCSHDCALCCESRDPQIQRHVACLSSSPMSCSTPMVTALSNLGNADSVGAAMSTPCPSQLAASTADPSHHSDCNITMSSQDPGAVLSTACRCHRATGYITSRRSTCIKQ